MAVGGDAQGDEHGLLGGRLAHHGEVDGIKHEVADRCGDRPVEPAEHLVGDILNPAPDGRMRTPDAEQLLAVGGEVAVGHAAKPELPAEFNELVRDGLEHGQPLRARWTGTGLRDADLDRAKAKRDGVTAMAAAQALASRGPLVTIGPNGLGDPPLRRRLEGEPQTLDDGRIDRLAQRLRRRRQRTGVAELGGYRRADAVLHRVPRRWHTLVGLRLGHLLCYIFHGHLLAFRPGPSWLRGCKHREGCAHLCLRSTRLHESRTADQPLRRAGGRWPFWCSRSHVTAPRPRAPAELKSAPGFLRYRD